MNHYENKIDPIGESFEKEPIEVSVLDKLEKNTILKNTYINMLKKETANLDELISGYETYTENIYMVKNLKNLSQRMKIDLKHLENACDGIDGFINETIK